MSLVRDSCRGGNLVFTNRIQLGRSIAVCLIALGYCVTSVADNIATMARPGSLSQKRLNSAAQNSTDFFVTHGNYAQTRYHPADRINTQTVKDLKFAWTFQVDLTESIQGAPIVYDGVMFLTASFNHLFAVDAKTGRELWHYTHVMDPAVSICCGPNNRGIAALGDLVYMATLDAKLVALNAKTGAVVWSKQLADPLKGYSMTAAPTAVDGKILIGLTGAEYGIRVNCIAPETILTERNQRRIPDEQKAALIESHPIKRLGTPDDVARAVLFLVSEDSSWITGVILDVAGGGVMVR